MFIIMISNRQHVSIFPFSNIRSSLVPQLPGSFSFISPYFLIEVGILPPHWRSTTHAPKWDPRQAWLSTLADNIQFLDLSADFFRCKFFSSLSNSHRRNPKCVAIICLSRHWRIFKGFSALADSVSSLIAWALTAQQNINLQVPTKKSVFQVVFT